MPYLETYVPISHLFFSFCERRRRWVQMRGRQDWDHEVVQKTYVEWSQSFLTKQMRPYSVSGKKSFLIKSSQIRCVRGQPSTRLSEVPLLTPPVVRLHPFLVLNYKIRYNICAVPAWLKMKGLPMQVDDLITRVTEWTLWNN
jgi:hypothetical protein